MRLSGEELILFAEACGDLGNIHAQELMNVFGVDCAGDVLRHAEHAPIGIFMDVVAHIWYAILHETSRRDRRWSDILERAMA